MKTLSRIASIGVGLLMGLTAAGRGEAGLNVWTTGGPAGAGAMAEVAFDPLTPTTVYAGGGSSNKGMFKSVNGGATWTPINNGLEIPHFFPLSVDGLVVNPQNSNVVYAGTFLAGVFKSTNGGASWVEANGPKNTPQELDTTSVVEMAIDPKNPGILYVGSTGGFSKTTDGGGTWARKEVGLPTNKYVFAIAVDPQVPTTLFISTQSDKVFRSANGGETWEPRSSGLPFAVNTLAVDPTNSNVVYAGMSPGGVAKTTNGGLTWAQTSQAVLNTVVTALVIDPVNPNTVYVGTLGSGVYRSTDGGATWATFRDGMGTTGIYTLAISPSGTCLHAGTTSSGVFGLETQPGGCVPTPVAALLPTSRSVEIGHGATVFATMINPSSVAATNCSIALVSGINATFSYQTTNPNTNALTGAPNQPANIPAGQFQTFVISLIPQAPINGVDVQFTFACTNTAAAPITTGVNTLLLTASSTPTPDMVALASTASNDGIVHVQNSVGAFAVASVNVGSGGQVTASVDTGGVALPVTLTVCLSNPANGQCLVGPAQNVTVPVNPNDTPTYSIFVIGNGTPVPFDPTLNRAFLRFKVGGITVGSTSVAVKTD